MDNRYNKTNVILNNSYEYKDLFMRKKINYLKQYSRFNFGDLKNLKEYNLDSIFHTFQASDKIYNLSQQYYGTPEYGWLILYTNKLSSELELKPGTGLIIYFPLDELIRVL